MSLTFQFPSKTSPGKTYTTTLHDDGSITCDETPGNECRGYKYSRKVPRSCTHCDAVREQVKTGKPISKSLTNEFLAPIQPMLASPLPEDKTIDDYHPDDWTMEEKYDGHRRIIRVSPEGVFAWSRLGNVVEMPAHLVERLHRSAYGLYDAEQLIRGGVATDVKALDKQQDAILAIFDVLAIGDAVTGKLTIDSLDRRPILLECVQQDDVVFIAPQFEPTRQGLQEIWSRGGEGAIVKRREKPYAPGKRSRFWIKFKKFVTTEVTIEGFLPGKFGPYSVIRVRDDDGIPTSVKSLNGDWREMFAREGEQAFVGRRMTIEHQGRTADSYRSPMADHLIE